MHRKPCLLLGALDRHEAHLRLAHRGADRRRIIGIVPDNRNGRTNSAAMMRGM